MTVETRPVSSPTIPVREPRWPDIQGLRAVAVLLTVVPRTQPAGIALFLGISGYVITHQIEREGFAFGRFQARRVRRLVPALATVLIAVPLLALFLQSPLRSGTTKAGLALVGAIALECLVLPMAVAAALQYWRASHVLAPVMLAGAVIALTTPLTWAWGGTAYGAGALLATSVTTHHTPVSRALALRPLTWMGDRSYSIYLWWWPVPLLADQVTGAWWAPATAAVLLLLPAYLTHRYVERDRPGLVVCAVAAALALAVGIGGAVAQPRLIPHVDAYRADAARPTFASARGCLIDGRPFHPDDIERCTVRVAHAKGWILLAGDDHTASLSTGVMLAARESGYDTVSLQGAGCAFARGATSAAVSNCAEMSGELLDRAVGANPPALAVVAESTPAETLRQLAGAGVRVVRVRDVPRLPCRGGYLLFRCSSPRKPVARTSGTLDPADIFCHRGTCSALLDGRLAYADAEHLDAIGSAALKDEFATRFSVETASTEPGSGASNSRDRVTAPR